MPIFYSKERYMNHLNLKYKGFTLEQAIQEFAPIHPKCYIMKSHAKGFLGEVLRRKAPLRFKAGYQKWKRGKEIKASEIAYSLIKKPLILLNETLKNLIRPSTILERSLQRKRTS
jgi:hypothetical protein